MIKKFAKILPYFVVMWICRRTGGSFGELNTGKKYKVRYFQIDEGEIVCFSEDLQKVFDERKEKKRETKLDKKMRRIIRKTSQDYELDRELKKHYEYEIEREKEERDHNL